MVGEPGSTDALHDEAGARDSWLLLLFSGAGLVALTWGVVQVFNRWVYLVGITQPLWACGSMVRNAGQNVLVLCDKETKAEQLDGMTLLDLESIVKESDFKRAWRKALFELDEKSRDGSVLIADFDEELDNALGMERKLLLLEELVLDQSRRVVVLSRVSLRGLTDAVRHAAGASAAAPDAKEAMLDRWRRIVKALVIVERRQKEPPCEPHEQRSPAVTFLLAERESHPEVRRVCDDLLKVDGAEKRLTRAQAFDELVERTAQFYRGLWMSCSEDEKVVLGHVARHGLANAAVRSVVRQLLGRGLLQADPAFRPMNETFRHFILTRECSQQVAALESENGPSAWDSAARPTRRGGARRGYFSLCHAEGALTTRSSASSQPRPRQCRRSFRPSENWWGVRSMDQGSRPRLRQAHLGTDAGLLNRGPAANNLKILVGRLAARQDDLHVAPQGSFVLVELLLASARARLGTL